MCGLIRGRHHYHHHSDCPPDRMCTSSCCDDWASRYLTVQTHNLHAVLWKGGGSWPWLVSQRAKPRLIRLGKARAQALQFAMACSKLQEWYVVTVVFVKPRVLTSAGNLRSALHRADARAGAEQAPRILAAVNWLPSFAARNATRMTLQDAPVQRCVVLRAHVQLPVVQVALCKQLLQHSVNPAFCQPAHIPFKTCPVHESMTCRHRVACDQQPCMHPGTNASKTGSTAAQQRAHRHPYTYTCHPHGPHSTLKPRAFLWREGQEGDAAVCGRQEGGPQRCCPPEHLAGRPSSSQQS
jgi:hypothetical protein